MSRYDHKIESYLEEIASPETYKVKEINLQTGDRKWSLFEED